jgi:hypothetical protein
MAGVLSSLDVPASKSHRVQVSCRHFASVMLALKFVSVLTGGFLQVNSNVLVKAVASAKRVCAAVVFKSWWNPSFTASLMSGVDLTAGLPFVALGGFSIGIENDILLQYERGMQPTHTGSLVRQKHVASRSEAMVAAGEKLKVAGGLELREKQDAALLVPPQMTHARTNML